MRRHRARQLAAAILLGLAASPVWARGGQGPRVDVVTAGPEPVSKELEDVLRELIGYLPVNARYERASTVDPRDVVAPHSTAPKSLAHVFIDLSSADHATVYIADGPWERILIRNVPLKNGADEVAREQIAHIVSAAVDALASGEHIGLTREEAERSLFGPAPEARAKPAGSAEKPGIPLEPGPASEKPEDYSARDQFEWHGSALDSPPFDLGVFYETQAWTGDQLFVHGPGASVHAALSRDRNAFGIWLSAQYRFALTEDQPPIGVRLHSGGARVLGTYDLPLTARVRLRPGVGLGADVVDVEPRLLTAGGGATTSEERTTLVPLARALLALQYRALRNTTLTAAFALDVELVNARYTVDRQGTSSVVLDPWPLRPALVLGVSSYVIAPP